MTSAGENLFIADPDTYDFVFDGHAGASPSGAERWMSCTSSLRMTREFLETLTPNQLRQYASGSSAARQGTTAHAAGEVKLRHLLGEVGQAEVDATLLELTINPDSEGEAYDNEMADHVQQYVDLVKTFIDDGREVRIETRVHAAVPLVGAHADAVHVISGSADCIALPDPTDPSSDLVVIDYKHGEGLDVDVEENAQARIYGLGALAMLVDEEGNLPKNADTITYYIVQPRTTGIKMWSETVESLIEWRDETLAPALTAALYDDEGAPASFSPSDDTCQWCPAKGACSALAEQRVEKAADLFDAIVDAEFADGTGASPDTGSLSDARLGALLEQILGLTKIAEDLKAEAQRRLHRGDEVPGFRLVGYTPPRKWKEGAVENIAAELPIWKEPTLLSPTQALAVLGDGSGQIADWIDTPAPRPVVAPLKDRRKDWAGVPPETMFKNETGE